MKKIAVATAAVLAVSLAAQGAVPQEINFQGKLTDTGGAPIDGAVSVTFRLYDAETSGSEVWSESPSVTAADGYISVILGQTTAITPAILSGGDRWLEVDIETETLSPRFKVAAAPYAILADTAEQLSSMGSGSGLDADLLDSQDSSYYVDWTNLTNVPVGFADGQDDDTLAGMFGAPGQIPKYDGASWVLSDDLDTQLTEAEVEAFVTNGDLAITGNVSATGNVQAGGDFKYAAAKTFYYGIPFCAFQDDFPGLNTRWYLRSTYGYPNAGPLPHIVNLYAPVNLPDGATVTGVTSYFYDQRDPENLTITMNLYAIGYSDTTTMNLASAVVTTSGSSILVRSLTDNTINNAVIDNQTYRYQLEIKFNSGDYANSAMRLYGARISYTLDTLNP